MGASLKVYIVHGWTYKLDMLHTLHDGLCQRGIGAVLLKVPGLTKPSDKVWTIDEYVEWLHEAIKDDKHPVVIGHSNGGRIALAYDIKYPGRFKHLFLIDAAGVSHQELLSRVKLATLRILSRLGKPLAKLPFIKKAFYKFINASDYNNAPHNMKLTMRNMLAADKELDISKITTPTTIIWGREDTLTPLSDGKKMHACIEGSTMHIIDGARHSPHFTHTSEVLDIIEKDIEVLYA